MSERLGDSKLDFGTTDETWGLVQGVTMEESCEEREGRAGNGNIVAIEQFNAGVRAFSGTYLYRNEGLATSPTSNVGSGTVITLRTSGESIYVKRITSDWKQGDFRQIGFEGTFWPNLSS